MTHFISRLLLGAGLLSIMMGCQAADPQATQVKDEQQIERSHQNKADEVKRDPNFKKLLGAGVAIYAPKGYEGGDPKQQLEAVADQLEAAGEEHEDLSNSLRQSKKRVALIAFDNAGDEEGFVTNLNISQQDAIPGTALSVFLETMLLNLEDEGYAIAEQSTPTLNGQEVGRLVVNATVGEVDLTQLVYVFKGESGFWLVTYASSTEEFKARLPEFEQSILTFKPTTTAAQRLD